MEPVALEGQLVCSSREEADLIAGLLPAHIALTRAEPGCLEFEVAVTDDPLVWHVSERFASAESFRAHQVRVAGSEWGRATGGIERSYTITGLDTQ